MPRNLSDNEIKDFRDRLCAVAEKLFAERGPQGVTMRELARAMGVSAMTPYRYFDRKEEILAVVRTSAFTRFAEALESAAAIEGTAVERARTVGKAYVDFAFKQPDAYKLMFDVNQPDAGRFPELVRAGRRARLTMTGYIDELIAEGILIGDDDMLGRIFWAMVHGLVMLHLTGKLDPKPDFTTVYETAMRLLGRGTHAVASLEQERKKKGIVVVKDRKAS
jgi:AcrR family transcriptional regulator